MLTLLSGVANALFITKRFRQITSKNMSIFVGEDNDFLIIS